MAETFEEQVAEAAKIARDQEEIARTKGLREQVAAVLSGCAQAGGLDVADEALLVAATIRANPAPVLDLISDDVLRAACRERGIGLAEDEYEQVGWHVAGDESKQPQVYGMGIKRRYVEEELGGVPVYVRRAASL